MDAEKLRVAALWLCGAEVVRSWSQDFILPLFASIASTGFFFLRPSLSMFWSSTDSTNSVDTRLAF